MRIAIAQDAFGGGGVESYLRALIPELLARGHAVTILHLSRPTDGIGVNVPTVTANPARPDAAIEEVARFRPDLCFSHNMASLGLERSLLDRWPVVKMMHGYFGTCVSATKTRTFPAAAPCTRTLGIGCLGMYFPRACGGRDPRGLVEGYRWARAQQALFHRYSAVVVASRHMARELTRNGVPGSRLAVLPLFPTLDAGPAPSPRSHETNTVLFAGRMTPLKGGDVLISAAAIASRLIGTPIRLLMMGEGSHRDRWTTLARELGVEAEFTGWLDGAARTDAFRRSSVLAVPSVWPEPFGLVGLEAASLGIPAVAFDVGGVREWVTDGVNGILVDAEGGAAAFASALVSVLTVPRSRARMASAALDVAARFSRRAHMDTLEPVLAAAARVPPS
jgi:glycosyltransferase involved in cell wall biosynthesis